MIFDILTTSGNGKLTKIKENEITIQFPTIMEHHSPNSGIVGYWQIGDSLETLQLNYPSNALTQENTHSNENIMLSVNFLMHKTLDFSVVVKQLAQQEHLLTERLKTHSKNNTMVLLHAPESLSILHEVLAIIKKHQIKHVGIANFLPLLNNPRQALTLLGEIRTTLPLDVLLYCFSPIPHTYLPILAYLGVDVFNIGFVPLISRQEIFLTSSGGMLLNDLSEKICFCEACNTADNHDYKNALRADGGTLLENHNKQLFYTKIREVRHALKMKDLRSYIEQNIHTNIFTAAALKLLDIYWSKQMILRTPTWLSAPLIHTTNYSYSRPEVKEFQKRIRERFQINPKKELIIILPCSAKKPYSSSRSHRKFLAVLDSVDETKRAFIQELILTSPLGVVPRQLELVYPAAHYDIPVTGLWDEEEKNIAISQLIAVLEKVQTESTIIAHVSDEYLELCKVASAKLNREFIYTSLDSKPTSDQALLNLKAELERFSLKLPSKKQSKDIEILRTLSDYQFGLGIGEQMFQGNYSLKQKPNQHVHIFFNGKPKGIIHHTTGQLLLTIDSGKILAKKNKYCVTLNNLELKGSTVFSVGVVDADRDIRPSDAVVILNSLGEICAIGEAIVSGKDMVEMSTGQAVKVRVKVKK